MPKVIDLERDDEIFESVLKFLCDSLGAIEFLEWSVLTVGNAGTDEQELDRTFLDRLLNIVPESFPAEQFREIAPNRVTLPRELKSDPAREFVVLGVSVTYKKHVTHGTAIRH